MMAKRIKELSIFIDESGDFGGYSPKSPYYIISAVFHDQSDDISTQINYLNRRLSETALQFDFVHLGPLIRREAGYKNMAPLERVQVLRRMLAFTSQINFSYKTFVVDKKNARSETELIEQLARKFSDFIKEHYPYFLSFDKLKIYYDNGQLGVVRVLIAVFNTLFKNTEFRKAMQKDYKMLQVADLICTAELTELKMKSHTLSRSERRVLGTDRDINKNLLKPLRKKEFKRNLEKL